MPCLKKSAAEYYSILSSNREKNFEWLKRRFKHRFGVVESAAATRMELLNIKQRENESLEEYQSRMQRLIIVAFPEEAEQETCSSLLIDTFMKGCRDQATALSAAEKKPQTLEGAFKLMLEATNLRKAILGQKVMRKTVSFEKEVSTDIESDWPHSSSSERGKYSPRSRSHRNRDKIKSVLNSLEKVLSGNMFETSSSHKSGCFECGDTSHFVRDCPVRRRRKQQRYSNRSDDPDWRSRTDSSSSDHAPRVRHDYQLFRNSGRHSPERNDYWSKSSQDGQEYSAHVVYHQQ